MFICHSSIIIYTHVNDDNTGRVNKIYEVLYFLYKILKKHFLYYTVLLCTKTYGKS